MSSHGGRRRGAGRKSKAEEQLLAEKLSPYEATAHKVLEAAVKRGEPWAVKLFFNYMYGKPIDRKDITTDGRPLGALERRFSDIPADQLEERIEALYRHREQKKEMLK